MHHRPTLLLTGAGGFIGRVLIEELQRAQLPFQALLGPPWERLPPAPAGLRVFRGDIATLDDWGELLAGVEIVVHLAGPAAVAASFHQAPGYVAAHTLGTARLLDASVRARVRRVVYLSSAEVYGSCPQPVTEEHPLQARSPYAAAKIGAERLVESFAHAFGIEALILRPFSIYGPGLSPGSLIGTILRQAAEGQEVTLQDLGIVRDYCYVTDLARAVLLACGTPMSGLHIVNIGSGTGTDVLTIASTILDLLGRSSGIQEVKGTARPGTSEIRHLVADIRRAGDLLGWRPQVSLRSGLETTIHSRV